ncbi:hypothetical protein SUGI_0366210 [Cryptomeria japonica]|nr:hypothetical protein SUGI_0366210 [Cryptomeria japonica]
MGGQRRNQSGKGGQRWTQSYFPQKEVVDFSRLRKTKEKWNDSAAEEAFHLAKRRYFTKINGAPCDVPEVDLNAYIDEVDWDSLDSGDIDWP